MTLPRVVVSLEIDWGLVELIGQRYDQGDRQAWPVAVTGTNGCTNQQTRTTLPAHRHPLSPPRAPALLNAFPMPSTLTYSD